MSKFDTIKV